MAELLRDVCHKYLDPLKVVWTKRLPELTQFLNQAIKRSSLITGEYRFCHVFSKSCKINCSYSTHKSLINNHLDALSKYLQIYIPQNMKRVLILGDFYTDIEEKHIKRFCDNHNLKSLVKQRTCYKKPDNPTCIDLLSTNASRSF